MGRARKERHEVPPDRAHLEETKEVKFPQSKKKTIITDPIRSTGAPENTASNIAVVEQVLDAVVCG